MLLDTEYPVPINMLLQVLSLMCRRSSLLLADVKHEKAILGSNGLVQRYLFGKIDKDNALDLHFRLPSCFGDAVSNFELFLTKFPVKN